MDLFIFVVFILGAAIGFMNGFVKQIASIAGLIAGLIFARMLFSVVGESLAVELGTSATIGQILAFILIWIIVPMAFSILGFILTRFLNAVHLGLLNRWMGAGLGAIKYLLIISMLFNMIDYIDRKNRIVETETKQQSSLYVPLKQFSGIFLPQILKVTNHLIH